MVDPCRTEVVLRRLRVSVILSKDPKLAVRAGMHFANSMKLYVKVLS